MGRERGNKPVYTIGIAAGILEVHPQTLRMYERLGLIMPHRTKGQTRLYSEKNIERVRFIKDLTQRQGVNLAGVEVILQLQLKLDHLRKETESLMESLRDRIEGQHIQERQEGERRRTPSKVIRIKVEKG
ncbi:MAG TPA: MerR family transcriptional regulator [Nitrospiria bacterium]|nr:MerR family transcriptional regulator [Nitrospiria bacterium]